ncbi:Na(+)/H(+) antiporter subunit C [Brachybacterium sp. AOP25-B2-12]|uniref:Na(+)/H(+) antiporter subunit C n=1 Tax=Brachybacterium sp. AOP25-B2-12 TaxID=3457710 RepID=UPI0040342955
MPVSLALVLTAGVLIACGIYLFLERTLTRVLLGFILAGNGVNLLFLVAVGVPGNPPFEGAGPPQDMSDPLPFAMVLTAIVITLGIGAFVIALAYRAWQLFGHDEVPDDVEDRRVLRRSRRRRTPRREAIRVGAAHAGPEGAEPDTETGAHPVTDAETGAVPAIAGLTEEHRHGALRTAQGADGGGDDGSEHDAPTGTLEEQGTAPREPRVAEAAGSRAEEPSARDEHDDDTDESEDPLGADLSSAEDAPMDHTESDEDEEEPR